MARKYPGSQNEEFEVALQRSGYQTTPSMHYGNVSKGFDVEVYEEENGSVGALYPYYIEVTTGLGTVEYIYAVDFPSLLTLLSQFGSITSNLMELPEYKQD